MSTVQLGESESRWARPHQARSPRPKAARTSLISLPVKTLKSCGQAGRGRGSMRGQGGSSGVREGGKESGRPIQCRPPEDANLPNAGVRIAQLQNVLQCSQQPQRPAPTRTLRPGQCTTTRRLVKRWGRAEAFGGPQNSSTCTTVPSSRRSTCCSSGGVGTGTRSGEEHGGRESQHAPQAAARVAPGRGCTGRERAGCMQGDAGCMPHAAAAASQLVKRACSMPFAPLPLSSAAAPPTAAAASTAASSSPCSNLLRVIGLPPRGSSSNLKGVRGAWQLPGSKGLDRWF